MDQFPASISAREKYEPAMFITKQAEADAYFEKCVQHCMRLGNEREEAEEIERDALGYFAGYFSHDVRARVEMLFRCKHPVFGAIAEVGAPTSVQAFEAGMRFGQALRDIQ